jgi:hypothetical protein
MEVFVKQGPGGHAIPDGVVGIVGVVFFLWSLRAITDAVTDAVAVSWQDKLRQRHRRAQMIGYLEYRRVKVFALDGDVIPLSADDVENRVLIHHCGQHS